MSLNTLSLLAYKVGPDTFDVSSGLPSISIRDQIVRARILARDLIATQYVKSGEEVLIVGAGAAGVSAAMVLAAEGCGITILSNSGKFGLQRGVTSRFVAPYMYEWPHRVSSGQALPPQQGSLLEGWWRGVEGLHMPADPTPAGVVASDWASQFALFKFRQNIRFIAAKQPTQIAGEILFWQLSRKSTLGTLGASMKFSDARIAGSTLTVTPRCVILAMGAGSENTTWNRPKRSHVGTESSVTGGKFWGNDRLLQLNAGFAKPPIIAVSGGGDGALQDALRALTRKPHPHEILHELYAMGQGHLIEAQISTLLSLDVQQQLDLSWAAGALNAPTKNLHDAYKRVAKTLMGHAGFRTALRAIVRPDIEAVHLIVKESCFGRAYGLNRLMALLFAQLHDARFEVHFEREVIGVSKLGQAKLLFLNNLPWYWAGKHRIKANEWIIRFGVDQPPARQLGISRADAKHRSIMAPIPLPFWPGD